MGQPSPATQGGVMTGKGLMIGLPRLHHLALTAWHRTIATTTDPYTRGKAEGRVIGLALALDQLQSGTNRKDR